MITNQPKNMFRHIVNSVSVSSFGRRTEPLCSSVQDAISSHRHRRLRRLGSRSSVFWSPSVRGRQTRARRRRKKIGDMRCGGGDLSFRLFEERKTESMRPSVEQSSDAARVYDIAGRRQSSIASVNRRLWIEPSRIDEDKGYTPPFVSRSARFGGAF